MYDYMSGPCRLIMNKCTQLPLMLPTYIHRHHVNKRGNVQTGWNQKEQGGAGMGQGGKRDGK